MWGAAEGFIRDECFLCDRSVEVRNSVQKLQISVPSCPRYSRGGKSRRAYASAPNVAPSLSVDISLGSRPSQKRAFLVPGIGHAIVAVRSGSTPINFVSVPRSSTVQPENLS